MPVYVRPDTSELVRQRLAANADDPDALFVLAALRVQDGDVDEGLTILDRVLRIDPRYPGGWRFKAQLHRMQGHLDEEASARLQADETEP